MYIVLSVPLKSTILLFMYLPEPNVVNVLVVRLLLEIAPAVEIVPVAVILTTLSMLLKRHVNISGQTYN